MDTHNYTARDMVCTALGGTFMCPGVDAISSFHLAQLNLTMAINRIALWRISLSCPAILWNI